MRTSILREVVKKIRLLRKARVFQEWPWVSSWDEANIGVSSYKLMR